MGVKHTVTLTRDEAARRFIKTLFDALEATFMGQVSAMSNEELEEALEEVNDDLHGGEGFENYLISE